MSNKQPRLYPAQVCFVVDDVPTAVRDCEAQFGWGPFHQFKAPIEDASYHDWRGKKTTEVALGMAGKVQVEFIHVHEGHDAVEAYQAEYGTGFQHIGISCKSRDDAVAALESIGAATDVIDEYPGIKFAFVDVPTGKAMFELLENTASPPAFKKKNNTQDKRGEEANDVFAIDRATIVTTDMAATLDFYTRAFRWAELAPRPEEHTLKINDSSHTLLRYIGKAGQLELELIQPLNSSRTDTNSPYTAHLQRGAHGLVHASGRSSELPDNPASAGEWLETGEQFVLQDWAGGKNALQLRRA